jgi:glycosyltransferase involved in cell wall biosynthesis
MKSDISIIIPVFNEVRTVRSVIEVTRAWGKAGEIIVVNDGSTDDTLPAVRQFGKQVKVIDIKKNRGKGWALCCGIRASAGKYLIFLDGDLTNITHMDLDAMIKPMLADQADMVLGVASFWGLGRFQPYNDITGERVVKREIVFPHIRTIRDLGYGVELFLNDLHRDLRIVRVRLPYVFILGKLEKQMVPDAVYTYLKEARELAAQIVRNQTGKLNPRANGIVKGVQKYLQQALDYFQ